MGPDKNAPVYPIGIVQKLVNLSGRQIRYYEQHGLIAPERTKGNQRLYSPNDVDRLHRIKALLAQGLTIDGIRQQIHNPSLPQTSVSAKEQPAAVDENTGLAHTQGVSQLDSLYPVRNQAALVRLLATRRAAQDKDATIDGEDV